MQLILLQWLYMIGLYEKNYIVMAVLQWLYEKILLHGIYYTCFITLTLTVTLTTTFTLTAKFTSSLLHNLNMPITQSPSNNKSPSFTLLHFTLRNVKLACRQLHPHYCIRSSGLAQL